jgi:hypothetical protein
MSAVLRTLVSVSIHEVAQGGPASHALCLEGLGSLHRMRDGHRTPLTAALTATPPFDAGVAVDLGGQSGNEGGRQTNGPGHLARVYGSVSVS